MEQEIITCSAGTFYCYICFRIYYVSTIYQTENLLHSICGNTCRRIEFMRMQDFIHLPQIDKATLLYEQGVYIGKRKQGKVIVILYQLEGFYAEIYYRTYRREIDHISCFSGTSRLDPYLASIDVVHLVI